VGLGGHPGLDFLNSNAWETAELLTGGQAYLRWLVLAGMIDAEDAAQAAEVFSAAELDRAAEGAVALREWLRPVVTRWARGDADAPGEAETARLNDVLATASEHLRLTRDGGLLRLGRLQAWARPEALLAPPAAAAADLFATGEQRLVRQCHASSVRPASSSRRRS
jgi:predicted RNA-binding Zn ribbon-like protein